MVIAKNGRWRWFTIPNLGSTDFTSLSTHISGFLAKLDKAKRAFCFASGMASLSIVTHLIGTSTCRSS
uniref:Uncharacterized protein n=1 Tax=Nelumbo nucifera TaxID=4432 RepID=A0A822YAW9_NELNU|nr:TPA_asm: hypothetical protein HUJ06_031045 [Nelumbo nucifera]